MPPNIIMSASISYEDIKYTLQDNILTFKKLKEKINITCWKEIIIIYNQGDELLT